MSKKFYAHSRPGRPLEEWQELEEHLNNVAMQAETCAACFDGGKWAQAAALLHDLGKYSNEFQRMLAISSSNDANMDAQPGRVDHSTAGAQAAVKQYPEIGKLLAYCIAGHHAGLPNGKDNSMSSLEARLRKIIPVCDLSSEFLVLKLPHLDKFPLDLSLLGRRKEEIAFRIQLFVRMIFSSLVDADFLDTESFLNPDKSARRPCAISLSVLKDRALEYISQMIAGASETLVNRKRREVFDDCLLAARKESGFFSLSVPTGGGKTLSSLAFAFEHAVRFDKKRIIYAIPFTSIIEQNADVFRKVLGDEAVLEHHSNFAPAEDDYKTQLNAENWAAPLIVTTNVQFFEGFFANRTSRCRKLHNIANSVIVLDEAQALPRDLLKPCLQLLKELVEVYKCTVVLCTATQPAFNQTEDFKNGLAGVREIIREPVSLYEDLKRVDLEILSKMENSVIAQQIGEYPQVLCVVNTRKHARLLFEAIPEKEGLYHLSALMCPDHRRKVLADVKEKLKNGEVCRLISTQLIEAGVDVDFPVVFRSSAGIDSIAQAAGRCNREGKLNGKGKVIIFDPQDGLPIGFLKQGAETSEGIIRKFMNDILAPDAVREYFLTMYWKAESLDRPGILSRMSEDVGRLNFPFADVSGMFRMINDEMVPVIIPYNEDARSIIRSLRYAEFPGRLLRRLQRYMVNIYPKALSLLIAKGAVEKVQDRFNVLINDHLYRSDIGLDDRDPEFRDVERDIF